MTSTHHRFLRGLALTAVVGAAALPLAACTSAAPPTGAPTSESSAAASADPAPEESPTATPPTLVSTPVDLDCASLVDPASLSALYPGLTAAEAPEPAADDADAADSATTPPLGRIAAADGTLCAWTDAANETITLGVAQYDDAGLTSLANDLVASSNSVPTYGVEGYFDIERGVGRAELFPLPYDVVLESTAFLEPGSAEPMAAQVVAALQATGATG